MREHAPSRRYLPFCILILLFAAFFCSEAVERFPRPDFETSYSIPPTSQPQPTGNLLRWIDILVLLATLGLSAKFAIFDRSRKKTFYLMIFSLIYFGFIKQGCICSIGAIQNLSLAVFDLGYAIPMTVLITFIAPLIFALYFGRVFCASVCPLGAIQDIFAFKPQRLPTWIREISSLIPYLYLGLAVLYAATASGFIICKGDYFVSFFRLSGKLETLIAGAVLLAAGIFIARPYCRFFCPYGLILNWLSHFSKWRLKISPGECVKCGMCARSCPFDAINIPSSEQYPDDRSQGARKLFLCFILCPLLFFSGIATGIYLAPVLSKSNPTIQLADRIIYENNNKIMNFSLESEAFRRAGTPLKKLLAEAEIIRKKITFGGAILGAFMAIAISAKLFKLIIWRKKEYPEPDIGYCLSCGRCQEFCPVHRKSI